MKDITRLEEKIGISFNNRTLLKQAFIHRSYLNESQKTAGSNEKLEFLGDSVLSLITSIYLYKKYPELDEGQYTDIKAMVVRTSSLAEAATALSLGDFIFLSKGEVDGGGRTNRSILADCFEALIAIIFLDKGFDAAYDFVLKFLFKEELANIVKGKKYSSSKNRLQEYLQDKHKRLPEYKILNEAGPEHDKTYKIGVYFDNEKIGEGVGKSKKEAEEAAANDTFNNL